LLLMSLWVERLCNKELPNSLGHSVLEVQQLCEHSIRAMLNADMVGKPSLVGVAPRE
jgi:hypothetical protein